MDFSQPESFKQPVNFKQRPYKLNGSHKLASNANLASQQNVHQDLYQFIGHRSLLTFFYIYLLVIVSLYGAYVAFQYCQSSSRPLLAPNQQEADSEKAHLQQQQQNQEQAERLHLARSELEAKLETKLHFLERYIELIALDLQETKAKLREREKCDCSIGCTFNGTRYLDKSSWHNQCETCVCQAGKISCTPKVCPKLTCDDAIILPGQCCPTCMRKCNYNNTLIRHGHKFNPVDGNKKQTKECKCFNGRIKCEQIQLKPTNKTIETINSVEILTIEHPLVKTESILTKLQANKIN